MKILIIDHHPLFREGLQNVLSRMAENLEFMHAEGLSSSNLTFLAKAQLILLELALADSSGVESLRSIKRLQPSGAIVVVSAHDNANTIKECIEAGAAGFIPKTAEPELLIAALQLVLAGGIYLPATCLAESRSVSPGSDEMSKFHQLTERQTTTLLLASYGLPNKSIANRMMISEGTVKLHLSAAYKTLRVRNRTEAVYLLSRAGLPQAKLDMLSATNKLGSHQTAQRCA